MAFQNLWLPLLLTILAGLATVVGSVIALFLKLDKRYLQFSLGLSAGVMIYVSFVDLLPTALRFLGFLSVNILFFSGILFIMIIDFLTPHTYIAERVRVSGKNTRLYSVGLFTTLGIIIHNIPEGLAVFVSSIASISMGISLAVAIAIHNIPEGIAIAMPIYHATKSKKKAFWYSFLAGIAEPAGAVLGAVILLPFLNATVLSYALAFVAGVMVFISFDELLPVTFKDENTHIGVLGVICGMLVMAASLVLMR